MQLLQRLEATVSAVANSLVTTNVLRGTVTRAGWLGNLYVNLNSSSSTSVPHGRYYATVNLHRSGNLDPSTEYSRVWAGYVSASGIASTPNVQVDVGDVLHMTVACGTNASANDNFKFQAAIYDTPSGASFIFSEEAGTGAGDLVETFISAPVAGADFTFIVPAYVRWDLHALTATLTAAVAVANRVPVFAFQTSGGVSKFTTKAAPAQLASAVVIYQLAPGYQENGTAVDAAGRWRPTVPTHERIWLGATNGIADQIISVTASIQAADQWSAVSVTVEEWAMPA